MANDKEKKCSICQVFDDVRTSQQGSMNGCVVKHFGVNWRIKLLCNSADKLYPYLTCEGSETENWSINTTCDVVVDKKAFKTGLEFEFKPNNKKLDPGFIIKKDIFKHRFGEYVQIEFHVKINGMTGIPEKQKSMKFDDGVAKEASDVVLVVGDQKFHVLKNYLSLHSTYFKTLFSGNIGKSQKSIIELKDIDSNEFQSFLEVLYAASPIENDTLSEILKLADFFDAKIVVRRCEEFLMNTSKETLKFKFPLAIKYKLAELKKKCFSEMTNTTNFKDLIPENAADFNTDLWKEFFLKLKAVY